MKKINTIILLILLAATVVFNLIEAVGQFKNGTPCNWFAYTGMYSLLTIGFSSIDSKKNENEVSIEVN